MKQCPHCQSMRTGRINYKPSRDEYGAVGIDPLGDISPTDQVMLNCAIEIRFSASYCLDCKGHWDVAVVADFYSHEVLGHE